MHALLRADPRADDGRVADAGDVRQHPLDVFREDVEPSGVTIISFLRPRMYS